MYVCMYVCMYMKYKQNNNNNNKIYSDYLGDYDKNICSAMYIYIFFTPCYLGALNGITISIFLMLHLCYAVFRYL